MKKRRKTIVVDEELYDWLLGHGRKGETFDAVLRRLLGFEKGSDGKGGDRKDEDGKHP
jgi:negative regulator of replication initiation